MRKRKVVLITGASTGLGLSLAKRLIEKDKYHLILSARESSLARFSEVPIAENENLWIRKLDIEEHKDMYDLIAEINTKLDGVDILINNAGVSYRSVVEHVTEKELEKQMSINFKSPLELIRLVLPRMRKKACGKIINISSVGGMMAMPTMAIYSASKFALEGASESLWYELKPYGISVTLVQPGFINSDSFSRTRLTQLAEKSFKDSKLSYHNHYKNMANFIQFMMRHTPVRKNDVSMTILKIMEQKNPPLRVAGSFDAWLFGALRRILPRSIYHWFLYKNLPGIKEWGREYKP
ncbi:MAG: SDR family NAD(P)-dependent oxidoreductase [Bdellovibrionota bacterium]